jgi:hypothetical protein
VGVCRGDPQFALAQAGCLLLALMPMGSAQPAEGPRRGAQERVTGTLPGLPCHCPAPLSVVVLGLWSQGGFCLL